MYQTCGQLKQMVPNTRDERKSVMLFQHVGSFYTNVAQHLRQAEQVALKLEPVKVMVPYIVRRVELVACSVQLVEANGAHCTTSGSCGGHCEASRSNVNKRCCFGNICHVSTS